MIFNTPIAIIAATEREVLIFSRSSMSCVIAPQSVPYGIFTQVCLLYTSVRDDMFEHMQTLPIRYFDQNTNGSIMSLYTNDTDTLRQMISQAIPQALMSFFTIIVTFISMLVLSPLLTLLAIVVIGILVFVTKKIGGNSGKYFVRQQVDVYKRQLPLPFLNI